MVGGARGDGDVDGGVGADECVEEGGGEEGAVGGVSGGGGGVERGEEGVWGLGGGRLV